MMCDVEAVPRHVFRFVERELYDYPINKATCVDYEERRADVLKRARQLPEVPDMPAPSLPGDEVGAKTLRLLALEQRISRVAFYVQAIDSVMGLLSEEERRLVQRKYFDADTSNEVLAEELGVSKSKFYLVRRDVVRKFAMRFGLV